MHLLPGQITNQGVPIILGHDLCCLVPHFISKDRVRAGLEWMRNLSIHENRPAPTARKQACPTDQVFSPTMRHSFSLKLHQAFFSLVCDVFATGRFSLRIY
jgi:hypothetical protein